MVEYGLVTSKGSFPHFHSLIPHLSCFYSAFHIHTIPHPPPPFPPSDTPQIYKPICLYCFPKEKIVSITEVCVNEGCKAEGGNMMGKGGRERGNIKKGDVNGKFIIQYTHTHTFVFVIFPQVVNILLWFPFIAIQKESPCFPFELEGVSVIHIPNQLHA